MTSVVKCCKFLRAFHECPQSCLRSLYALLLGRNIMMGETFFHCMGLQVCKVCMVNHLWLYGELWSRDACAILQMRGFQIQDAWIRYFSCAIIRYTWCVVSPAILDWVLLLSAHQDCKSLDGWNHRCPINNDCSALNHGLQIGRIDFHYNVLTSPVGYTRARSQLP